MFNKIKNIFMNFAGSSTKEEKTLNKENETKTVKKVMRAEIATRQRSQDFVSYLNYLPDPDSILRKFGKDITVYKDLLKDSHVGACMGSRKAGVKSLEWSIDKENAGENEYNLIKDAFKNLNIDRLISEILDCVWYGYQPIEITWQKQGSFIIPKKIEAKPSEWFHFDEYNKLRFKSKHDFFVGEELPDKKFLCPTFNASYANPYGERVASSVFWPLTFKKGSLEFWVVFIEKYGMPHAIGKHPRGASEDDKKRLLDSLENMIQDAVAAIPDDSAIEVLERKGTDSSDIYKAFHSTMNAEISKAILGQTLTTEVGSKGSYAASKTHMDVRGDIIDSDKRIVVSTINKAIQWIHEINFATGEPPVFKMWEEEKVDKELAERDKTLSETGIKFTKKYYEKAYKLDKDDFELVEVVKPDKSNNKEEISEKEKKEFAEGSQTKVDFSDQEEIDNLEKALKDKELQAQMEKALKPVFDLMKSSNNYNEAMEKLSNIYPDMNTTELEEKLQKIIFISDVWGRLNAGKN